MSTWVPSNVQKKGLSNAIQSIDHINVKNNDNSKSFKISSYHVSCVSDKFDGSDMMGIVIYQYNGKTQWELNGVRCRSGYVFLCKSNKLKLNKYKCFPRDSMHARCYKILFNVDPDFNKIVGAGFGYQNGKWKYNSGTFCAPANAHGLDDDWHDNNRKMSKIEIKWIKKTVKEWVSTGKQTLYVQDAMWGWWNGKWINYDIETNKDIENKYKQYSNSKNNTSQPYSIDLTTGIFGNGKRFHGQYKLYFDAPNISINPSSIQSRNNVKWKNDKDKRNKYFLQENHITKKYRIVCRRDMSKV